ncbi:BnaC01g27050D [Brassica napus]|uniref:ATP synthase subunit 9, mitochondrial n=1 Tax=Brassica napus TaxID=3708 RepID=A0A078FX52_BRANA|nr:BnaC01g27050D [Brassica napus]
MTKREENYQPEMLEGAKSIGAGAATIASAGAAIGIGNVFSSLIHSVARNPSLAKQSFGYAILGFALTEAIALFAPMMAFLILLYSDRIKKVSFIIHLVSPALPLLEPIIWAAVGGGALPSTGPNGAERDTIREEDSFEL